MEITVIDDSDHVGWAASATRIGEIYMTDVQSMVDNVLAEAGENRISRLNILDHGNSTSFQIGTDRISLTSISRFEPTLARLNGHFTNDGFVHLQHCEIGNNHPLLARLAAIFGVGVIAGTGLHNPVYRFNFGNYERCNPDGTCESNVRRPGSPPPRASAWDNPNKVCCFDGATLVAAPGGAVQLCDLSVGQSVYSFDADTQRVVTSKVAAVEVHRGDHTLHQLDSGSGSPVLATDTHRFATAEQQWIPTEHLTLSRKLTCADGTFQLSDMKRYAQHQRRVLNIRVERYKNYFVGTDRILVRDY